MTKQSWRERFDKKFGKARYTLRAISPLEVSNDDIKHFIDQELKREKNKWFKEGIERGKAIQMLDDLEEKIKKA